MFFRSGNTGQQVLDVIDSYCHIMGNDTLLVYQVGDGHGENGVMPRDLPAPLQHQRLARHLARERDALFTFLYCPGLEATNRRAEPAIPPMLVTRKVWGGNRATAGARTQSILLSVFETCRQQHRSAIPLLGRLLCLPQPRALNLNPAHSR